MSERLAKYDPVNPKSNIHGMVGVDNDPICITRNDNLCTGCCYALHVEDEESGFYKEAGVDCPERVPTEGCKFITQKRKGRPHVCNSYHCSFHKGVLDNSPTIQERRAALMSLGMNNEAAWISGEITDEERDYNLIRHIGRLS